MASKKKLIQNSKTQNILENYSFVLFIQQPQKKYVSNIEKLSISSLKKSTTNNFSFDNGNDSLNNKDHIRVFRYKNTIIEKCLSNIKDNDRFNSDVKTKKNLNKRLDFKNIFQGPNMLVAGQNLSQLPAIWKSLNSIPHIFFCGAMINNTFYNHLDLEQAVENVYNKSSDDIYNRLISTLIEGTQINELSRDFELKVSAFFNLNTHLLLTKKETIVPNPSEVH